MITVQRDGRRSYLTGNTYTLKDKIKAAGGHWDADRKAWWVGDHAKAEQIASTASSAAATPRPEFDAARTPIRGRAEYKGKGGYLVLWEGTTSRGDAVKLAFRDGSSTFWADAAQVRITKRYGREDYRTGRTEYPTLDSLRRYAEEARQREAAGGSSCWRCDKYCTCGTSFCSHHHDGCETCGAEG